MPLSSRIEWHKSPTTHLRRTGERPEPPGIRLCWRILRGLCGIGVGPLWCLLLGWVGARWLEVGDVVASERFHADSRADGARCPGGVPEGMPGDARPR